MAGGSFHFGDHALGGAAACRHGAAAAASTSAAAIFAGFPIFDYAAYGQRYAQSQNAEHNPGSQVHEAPSGECYYK